MAQAYPNRPVRLIAPYGAGGSYDLIARIVAQKLGEQMGQQVIVDNRPGAAGRIGMETAVKAAPDGYTLVTIGNSQVIVPIVYGKAPYDLARDITPITTTATITNTLIVNPSLPARSVAELVALSKSKPQTVRFGSGGTGGITHLMGEYFKSMSGADVTHVPYKAGIMSVNATLGGEIEMIFLNAFQAAPLIQSGKLRGLAVTSLQRSRFLPSLPTLDESGLKGYEVLEFHSIAAPRGLQADVLKRLHSEIAQAVSSRDVTEKLTQQAAEGSVRSPEQLRQFIKTEHDKYEQIVKTVGIK
ncbi:MAG: Bug family tripartite tricarboxylate transporter substrate binding protein, partial [Burkholderiales bacterium]